MLGNAKARPIPPFLMNAPQADSSANSGWRIQLTLGQVALMWGIMALVMVLVFFFGLYAGREQGIKLALEEQSTPTLRAPLTQLQGIEEVSPAPAKPAAGDENFDFSRAESVAAESAAVANQQSPSTGLSGRSTTELLGRVDSVKSAPTDAKLSDSKVVDSKIEKGISQNTNAQPALNISVKVQNEPALKKTAIAAIEEEEEIIEEIPAKTKTTEKQKPAAALEPVQKVQKKIEKPEPVKPATTVAHGWFVQLSAPSSQKEADGVVRGQRSRGVERLSVQEAKVKGLVHFRVLMGPYGSREEAERARKIAGAKSPLVAHGFVKNY